MEHIIYVKDKEFTITRIVLKYEIKDSIRGIYNPSKRKYKVLIEYQDRNFSSSNFYTVDSLLNPKSIYINEDDKDGITISLNHILSIQGEQ